MSSKIGTFAVCRNGDLGLVLYQTKCVAKRTNKPYTLYHGICLSPSKRYGCNWQSKNPEFLTKSQFNKLWKERRKSV